MSKRPSPSRLDWLNLLDISGPFLSPAVIDRVFPQGLDVLDSEHAARLRLARDDWVDSQTGSEANIVHQEWIGVVLSETLGYTPEVLMEGAAIPETLTLSVPEYETVIRPTLVLDDNAVDGATRGARLLIQTYPRRQNLDAAIEGSTWAATPSARMTQLCRASKVRLGLVTNGEQWMLVDAPEGETSAFVSWYAGLWSQEPDTLRAFRSLLHARRFFGVDESETLESMLADSAAYQAEVTEQLGAQVRRAIEVLVRALDRADVDTGRRLLEDVSESELYEAAVTVMMRLVFLFFAEESGLLLLGDAIYDQYYSASMLRGQLREEADRVGVEVLERRQDAWSRLLATFRGIFAGVDHESLRLPAYGGSLFDPDRFPFLEGRKPGTTWMEIEATPLPIDNRTVLLLLDALQVLQTGGRAVEARKLSFRALDIEQIGHVYESLLDHVAVRAAGPVLGLVGPRGSEAEVSLDELDELRRKGEAAIVEFLTEKAKKSQSTVVRALKSPPEPDVAARLRVACGDDEQLLTRVLPYHAVIRDDPWGDPVVVQAGSIYVTAGAERRGTGTYYTPRALTEEVVTYALEPLVYRGPAEGKPPDNWELKKPAELLQLKICDFTMGSGAFLVQACRWLGERLVESWQKAGADESLITPEGAPATGLPSETIVPAGTEEKRALARRIIADRCLYGVDVNPLAVEMAKLSIWLITLAKGRPFSFLDHAIKCGDSLLGVHDLDQLKHFHIDPDRGRDLHATLFDPTRDIEPVLDEALGLRRQLESFTVLDVRDASHKQELNAAAETAVNRLRIVGDLLIGAAISTAEQGRRALDDRLVTLGAELLAAFGSDESARDGLAPKALLMLDKGRPESRPRRRTFHWPLEFPEVFLREQPGFDALLGNPPFRGGKRITGTLGTDYRALLIESLANGRRGNADLVAYFYLRASLIVRSGRLFCLLATNTISQGDTREVGLDQIVGSEWAIVRAWKSRAWPGDATVQIAIVWLYRGGWRGSIVLDGAEVTAITASLDAAHRGIGPGYRLEANQGHAFIGSLLNGIGFVLSPDEARDLIGRNEKNREVLFPYLNGADLNASPIQAPSRWVISFHDWPLSRAEQYPDCLAIVRDRVKPQRDKLRDYKRRVRENWWLFEYDGTALYDGIARFSRTLAIARVSKTVTPVFVSTGIIYSEQVVVFAYEDYGHFGLLTSAFHWWWAVTRASTMRTDLRYTPTDCFETFAYPQLSLRLTSAAEALDTHRRTLMRERQEGLTKTYNRVGDASETSADITTLRELHIELDHAVATAYGWSDLSLDHGFYDTSQGVRFTVGPQVRVELLDRLLELNHERHAVEAGAAQLSRGKHVESFGG